METKVLKYSQCLVFFVVVVVVLYANHKKRSDSEVFIGFGRCVCLPRNDIPNKIYQKDIRLKNPATVRHSLFVYFSISIRAIQISSCIVRAAPSTKSHTFFVVCFFFRLLLLLAVTFNRSENLYAFSRSRKIYGCFSNKVSKSNVQSSNSARIARWLISFLLVLPKPNQRVNLCIHRKRNHQPIWLFMCIHTQSYYIMCKYEANADLVKSVLSTAFSFTTHALSLSHSSVLSLSAPIFPLFFYLVIRLFHARK